MPIIIGASLGGLALIALIVFLASGGDEGDNRRRVGGGADVDDLGRTIDDPRFPHPSTGSQAGTGPGTAVAVDKGHTTYHPRTGNGSTQQTGGNNPTGTGPGTGKTEMVIGPDGEPLEPLEPDDVVSQAQKNATGTQRCYERALKKDPFIKVKSIAAVISIGADGKVNDVSLDQMQSDPLGQCLVAAIKRWPFRHSTAGINTKITLKFEQTIGP